MADYDISERLDTLEELTNAPVILLRKHALEYLKDNDKVLYKRIKPLAYVSDIFVYIMMAIVAIVTICLLLNTSSVKYDYTVTRHGYYDNGRIRYIQNVKQYADMNEYDLNPDDYTNGDTFYCLFDQNDKLTQIVPSDEFDKPNEHLALGILIMIIIAAIVTVLFIVIGRKTFLKPYSEYITWFKANIWKDMNVR